MALTKHSSHEYQEVEYHIYYDPTATNPFEEWDTVCEFLTYHPRYDFSTLNKVRQLYPDQFGDIDSHIAAIKEEYEAALVLPLYMYEHSGRALSLEDFSDPWDSGQVGYVVITWENIWKTVGKNWKRLSKKRIERLTQIAENEVQLMEDYIEGNVYGYTVEHEFWGISDSCWGYYGDAGIEQIHREVKQIIDYQQRQK